LNSRGDKTSDLIEINGGKIKLCDLISNDHNIDTRVFDSETKNLIYHYYVTSFAYTTRDTRVFDSETKI